MFEKKQDTSCVGKLFFPEAALPQKKNLHGRIQLEVVYTYFPWVLAHFLRTLAESLGMKRLFEKNADLCTQTPPTWLLATRNSNPQLLNGRFFRYPAAFAFVMRFPNRNFPWYFQ
jgi:hypothetical protein